MSHFVKQGYEPKIVGWVMSDIGDISSPRNATVGSWSTRVDPKLFGKPSDFSGARREWRHFEWVFCNWFGFLYDATEEWLDQAASAPGELGEGVPERRETEKTLYVSLAMVCKNEALDVVKRKARARQEQGKSKARARQDSKARVR